MTIVDMIGEAMAHHKIQKNPDVAGILEAEQEKQRAATAAERKSQVGTGDRSERIRTYNYPQGRVTDHRIGLTLHKLPDIINGDLDELLDALMMAEQAKKLQQVK